MFFESHPSLKSINEILAFSTENTWNVWVKTSDVKHAGTDANVFLCLYGNKGKTEEVKIENKGDTFEKGQVDTFKVNMVDVGQPYKLRVYHDNTGSASGWHLEKVCFDIVLVSSI